MEVAGDLSQRAAERLADGGVAPPASAVDGAALAPDLMPAMQASKRVAPRLREMASALDVSRATHAVPWEPARYIAALRCSFQWCRASASLTHGRLMERAFNAPPITDFETIPSSRRRTTRS